MTSPALRHSPGSPHRVFARASLRVERRAASEGQPAQPTRLIGHAAVFDQSTTLYDGRYYKLRETIRPGAFSRAIREKQDVRALFNHDENFILGRTKSGTLSLGEDATGLTADCLPPDTQTVRDLVVIPCEREDLDGMSFAFLPRIAAQIVTTENDDGSTVVDAGGIRTTRRYEGEILIEEDEILDADLYDVSVVTYPAYAGTDVSCRFAHSTDMMARAQSLDHPHVQPTKAPLRASLRSWLSEAK